MNFFSNEPAATATNRGNNGGNAPGLGRGRGRVQPSFAGAGPARERALRSICAPGTAGTARRDEPSAVFRSKKFDRGASLHSFKLPAPSTAIELFLPAASVPPSVPAESAHPHLSRESHSTRGPPGIGNHVKAFLLLDKQSTSKCPKVSYICNYIYMKGLFDHFEVPPRVKCLNGLTYIPYPDGPHFNGF